MICLKCAKFPFCIEAEENKSECSKFLKNIVSGREVITEKEELEKNITEYENNFISGYYDECSNYIVEVKKRM